MIVLTKLNDMVWLNNYIFSYILDSKAPMVSLIMFYELGFIITTLMSWIVFTVIYYKEQSQINDLLYRIKSLPFKQKLLLIPLTIFVSIPNRVYVYNNTSNVITWLLIIIYFILSFISPILIILLVCYWAIIIESIIIGYYLDNYTNVKATLIKRLFNGNETLAILYLYEFWGNSYIN